MSEANEALHEALAHFGLGEIRAVGPGGGTAGKAWRIGASSGDFFVRRRGPRTSGETRLRFDHGLRAYLAARGFPTHPALPADTGEPWVRVEDAVFEVYPFVEGRVFAHGRDRFEPVARCLARLHGLAADYAAESEPLIPQFHGSPFTTAVSARFDDPSVLLSVVEGVIARRGTGRNLPDLLAARARVAWLAGVYGPEVYDRLPVDVVHGDFNCCNLLVDGAGEVAGVFDLDWATRAPRVFDLGEAAFFFAAPRSAPPDGGSIWSLTACPTLDGPAMAAFVAAYEEENPLTAEERRAWPLAMLARWVAWRTEGIPKVPEERQAAFLLQDFHQPFEWYERSTPCGI